MDEIYTSGQYLKNNPSWGSEDSAWKATKILELMRRNQLAPSTIADVGCGVGVVLGELRKGLNQTDIHCLGYDVSPQAIAKARVNYPEIEFLNRDFLLEADDSFDLVLAIDVFEHIPDYMGFLKQFRTKARLKIYHIPLDLHVSGMVRNSFYGSRKSFGHLHYFTADTALATLRDTGHQIIDRMYTDAGIDLFRVHPSFKKGLANAFRWPLQKFNADLAVRFLGGSSLLVLAR